MKKSWKIMKKHEKITKIKQNINKKNVEHWHHDDIFHEKKIIYPNIQNPQLLGFAKLWLHRGGTIVTS